MGNSSERAGGEVKFAVLIPAREESAVISGLLDSLAAQTVAVDFANVYVVVERRDDPTVQIAKSYGAQVVVRKKVAGRGRKGYALAEVVEGILRSGKRHEAYFVCDADNVLDLRFIEKMWRMYDKGYDVCIGQRRVKNPQTAMAVGSGLIFAITGRLKIISGTGFYIAGRVLERLGTYPFHSLTEDYELSIYAVAQNLKVGCAHTAVFYDEQPESYGQYFRQRTRWVKGYFEARRNFRGKLWRLLKPGCPNPLAVMKKILGIYGLLALVIALVLLGVYYALFSGAEAWLNLLGLVTGVYLALAVLTVILLALEKYKLSFALRTKVILLNPLLLASYVPCFIAAICSPNLGWKPIEHRGGKNAKNAV